MQQNSEHCFLQASFCPRPFLHARLLLQRGSGGRSSVAMILTSGYF
jgi:hypothetical protein